MEAENHWIMCFDTETTGIGPAYKDIKYTDKQTLFGEMNSLGYKHCGVDCI